jgi:hypothetical protein
VLQKQFVDFNLTRCLREACKEVLAFCPTALAALWTPVLFWWGRHSHVPVDQLALLPFIIFNMAEDGVATKDPESDVHESSTVSPGDTQVQQGASMGVQLSFSRQGPASSIDKRHRTTV